MFLDTTNKQHKQDKNNVRRHNNKRIVQQDKNNVLRHNKQTTQTR